MTSDSEIDGFRARLRGARSPASMPWPINLLLTTAILFGAYWLMVVLGYDGYCYGFTDGKSPCSFAEHARDSHGWFFAFHPLTFPFSAVLAGVVFFANNALWWMIQERRARRDSGTRANRADSQTGARYAAGFAAGGSLFALALAWRLGSLELGTGVAVIGASLASWQLGAHTGPRIVSAKRLPAALLGCGMALLSMQVGILVGCLPELLRFGWSEPGPRLVFRCAHLLFWLTLYSFLPASILGVCYAMPLRRRCADQLPS